MTELQLGAGQQPADQAGRQHSYIANNTKGDYLKRLRRIEGQARGLQRMVDEEQYCIDILTQVSAMTRALQSVALGLLDEHMAHCVVDAAREGGREAEIKLKEASDAIARRPLLTHHKIAVQPHRDAVRTMSLITDPGSCRLIPRTATPGVEQLVDTIGA